MSCRTETVRDAQWIFCPDTVTVEGARPCALMRAQLVDEITRLPVDADALSVPDPRLAPHVRARSAGGGVVGLAGVPLEAFPRLASEPAQASFLVRVDGYVPLTLRAAFPADSTFPGAFTPRDLGTVGVRRRGVELTGQVVAAGLPAATPLVGAAVAVEGLWLQAPLPGVSLPGAMVQPFLVALSSPLAADWPAAQLDPCDEVPDVLNTKLLREPAPPGSTRLRLSDRTALGVLAPLSIAPGDPDRAEVIAVRTIDTALDPGQPCWVELHYPVQHLHREDTPVVPLAVTPVAGARTLSRPASAGDAVTFLNAVPPWADGRLVRIQDGVLPPEFRRIARYEAVTDGQGRFRLPLLSRLAFVQLRATHATQPTPLQRRVTLDYRWLQQNVLLAFE